jgi:predicted fused transcriptional regulator/phosphomethylpyrimidine kinase/predicted transcriptional regulator
MREMTTIRLSQQGFSQGKIAAMLGVTQASVSIYLRSQGRARALLNRLGVSEEDGEVYASLLAEDMKKDPVYAVNTLYSIWSDILGRGALCAAHRSRQPSLAQCDMCIKTFGAREGPREGDAVEHVAEAVRKIEASSIFVRVMPEVSVNIAYAREGASSVQDVVAVPGRIVKVRGMPRSFMRPEYGASTHVANILLAVMSHDRSVRAAINLRYDLKMGRVLSTIGLRSLNLDESRAHRTDAKMLGDLRGKLGRSTTPVEALVDPGGPGIEPGLYLFAGDAEEVVQLALRVARAYVGEG